MDPVGELRFQHATVKFLRPSVHQLTGEMTFRAGPALRAIQLEHPLDGRDEVRHFAAKKSLSSRCDEFGQRSAVHGDNRCAAGQRLHERPTRRVPPTGWAQLRRRRAPEAGLSPRHQQVRRMRSRGGPRRGQSPRPSSTSPVRFRCGCPPGSGIFRPSEQLRWPDERLSLSRFG